MTIQEGELKQNAVYGRHGLAVLANGGNLIKSQLSDGDENQVISEMERMS